MTTFNTNVLLELLKEKAALPIDNSVDILADSYRRFFNVVLSPPASFITPKRKAAYKALKRVIASSKRKPCKLSDLYLTSKYYR